MKKIMTGLNFIFFIHTAHAAVDCAVQSCRYVRAGATGNGTDWSNALGSLPATLVRGTYYFMADGNYSGRTLNTPVSGSLPITILKATVSDHGTNIGWSDSFGASQAVFNGQLDFTTSNWVLDGQTGGGAGNWDKGFGFKIVEQSDSNALIRIAYPSYTANNISIRHVDMVGKGSVSLSGGSYSNDGLAVYGASNITLSYYHMKGIGRCPFFAGGITNGTFEYGWVESYFGSGAVHSEIASIFAYNKNVGDHTFRYNLFTDIQSTGGLMWDNSSNTTAHMYVYGNVFYKPSGAVWGAANGLIGGWSGANGEQFHNVIVYNNSFINIDQETLSTFPNIASGNIAENNLFYNCTSPDFSKFQTHNFNHFINSGGAHAETNGTSAASGNPFTNLSGLNFQLIAPTSSGLILNSPFNLDPTGRVRGADGVMDRGAFEFVSSSSGGQPLSAPSNLRVFTSAL